jgi:hypothetical protein
VGGACDRQKGDWRMDKAIRVELIDGLAPIADIEE